MAIDSVADRFCESKCWFYINLANSIELEGLMENLEVQFCIGFCFLTLERGTIIFCFNLKQKEDTTHCVQRVDGISTDKQETRV